MQILILWEVFIGNGDRNDIAFINMYLLFPTDGFDWLIFLRRWPTISWYMNCSTKLENSSALKFMFR